MLLQYVLEYQALILGLKMAVDMKQLQLQVFGDSKLVINQLLESYEVKKPELRHYHEYAQKLIRWLGDVNLQEVPRKENKKADALATLASILTLPNQSQIIIFQKRIAPPDADEERKLEHLVAVSQAEIFDWRHALIDYLFYNILPKDPKRKTEVRVMLHGFFTINIFYIKNHLRGFSCVIWEKKKVIKLRKKHILDFMDRINLD